MFRSRLLILCAAALLLASCSSNPVSQDSRTQGEALLEMQRSAITEPGTLSFHAQLVYRMLELAELAEEDPAAALVALDLDRSATISPLQRMLAVAETCYLLADQEPDETEARRLFARALVTALKALRENAEISSVLNPEHRLLGDIYSRGLARFIVLSGQVEGHPKDWRGIGGDRPLPVVIERIPGAFDPADFDTFLAVDDFDFSGIDNRHLRFGVGVPMIATRDNRQGQGRKDPLRAPKIAEPVTVVAGLKDDGSLGIAFLDPRRVSELTARGGRTLKIAADFGSPLEYLVANSPLYSEENPSLFDPESFEHVTGLYFAEPYDPNKIPLILTHGLWSSPLTWIWIVNEVWGDPVLRDRYQVWYFAYPTGLPIAVNARSIRRAVTGALATIDPEGDDPATQGIVMVGHSMGGLLTKHLTKHLGDSLWNARFALPFDQVKGSPEDIEYMRECVFHEPLPQVERAIFMSTPHRGSTLAEGFIGAVGDAMITLPEDLVLRFQNIVAANPGLLRPGEAFDPDGPITSIKNLRSDSPHLLTLDAAPWKAGLPIHTILGDEDEAGKIGGTDGVVPYVSGHQDAAVSELVVHSGHSTPQSLAAMAELRRILHEHLVWKDRGNSNP